ncbi:MAG: hypothetical protein U9N59_09605 [Campylobacterota bacterium]|nr:hypothetical protein [Campylobacterota bacterium]
MNKNFQKQRTKKILLDGVKKFHLNLDGLVVFTEAASGNYAYTPISAALAGAKKVYAITKDSRYGTKEEITENIYYLAKEFGVEDKIEVVYEKTKEIISQCDIVTNSGFVRPIDKTMIDMMKPTAVIPLMWETWEVREDEIDLEYCREKEIVVLGTHEDEGGLNLYNATGLMALKMLFDSGLSIYNDKILIIGECPTVKFISEVFKSNNLDFNIATLSKNDKDLVNSNIQKYDAIIVSEHIKNDLIIGQNGFIRINEIKEKNPNVVICHIFGNIDVDLIKHNELNLYPKNIAPYGYMSYSLDDIDSRAVIELIQSGLKVGEVMANNRRYSTYQNTITESLENSLLMGFRND